jgi:hypothetical protein
MISDLKSAFGAFLTFNLTHEMIYSPAIFAIPTIQTIATINTKLTSTKETIS